MSTMAGTDLGSSRKQRTHVLACAQDIEQHCSWRVAHGFRRSLVVGLHVVNCYVSKFAFAQLRSHASAYSWIGTNTQYSDARYTSRRPLMP